MRGKDEGWAGRRKELVSQLRKVEGLRVEAVGMKERECFALDTRIANQKRMLEQKYTENQVIEQEIKKMESTLIKLEEREKAHKAVVFEGACRVSDALDKVRQVREEMLRR